MATKRLLLLTLTGINKSSLKISNCHCSLLVRQYSNSNNNNVFQTQFIQRVPKVSPANWSRSIATTGKIQADPSKSQENAEDSAAALRRLKEFQSRQKILLEEPDEEETHVIYTGLLTKQMRSLKMFSFTTSLMGIAMQPVLLQQASEVPLAASIAMFGVMGFFTFGTPLLIHSIAKKYVTEMIYDPKTDMYKATTFSFFLQKNEIDFKIDDITVPDVPGPFTTFTLKDKDGNVLPFFVAPESFLKTSHYGRMMGYDKPIDFRMTQDEKDAESEKKSRSSKS